MKFRSFILALGLSLAVPGCVSPQRGSAIFSTVMDGLQTALMAAQAGFEVWAGSHPEAAAQARVTFNSILSSVTSASGVARSGYRALTTDDPAARTVAVQEAMGNLHEFLRGLPLGEGGAAPAELVEAIRQTGAFAVSR